MKRNKQRRISTEELKNLKENMKKMEKDGTESQRRTVEGEFSYVFGASHLSMSTARFIARRLGVSFETLCGEVREEREEREEDYTDMQEEIGNQIQKNDDSSVAARLNAFLERTGKTGIYVANRTGVSKSSVSMLRRYIYAPRTEKALEKALSVLPCSVQEIMDADPKELVLSFEEANAQNKQCMNTRKSTAKTKKKSKEKTVEEDKTENKPAENVQTNLEYYRRSVIETANDFIRNGKQSASRATMNALRAVVPESADTPAKVLAWLMEKHEDRYVLNEAEKAMLDGYFKIHKNALTMQFSCTYMYTAKRESGMFANIPGNITLEYLRDHAVTKGGDISNG